MPRTRAVLAQVAASIFRDLGISAALTNGTDWYPLHVVKTVFEVELAHSVEHGRWAYNGTHERKARASRRPVLGEYAGFCDLFVPVKNEHGPSAVLVVGPFLRRRSVTSDFFARWHSVVGSAPQATDPEFLHYVSATLSVLTLEGDSYEHFKRLLVKFAKLLEGSGDADQLDQEIAEISRKLHKLRFTERTDRAVREMIDERTTRGATGAPQRDNWNDLGIPRCPDDVLVGILTDSSNGTDADRLARLDAFHRGSVALAQRTRDFICARLGDTGVALLVVRPEGKTRMLTRQRSLAEQVTQLAKRHSFQVRLGLCSNESPIGLPARYQAALAAAERAEAHGPHFSRAEVQPKRSGSPLATLRTELVRVIPDKPLELRPRFERFLEAATVHSGHRIEALRAHLECALDLLSEALRTTGAVEERSLVELDSTLRETAARAGTQSDLAAAYRHAMLELEAALSKPTGARQDRSLGRALDYVRDHFAEKLSLSRVAQVAGFAPAYFSALFASKRGVTFHDHVRNVRVGRARDMLMATTLSVEQVARTCGFPSRNRFYVAFRDVLGVTPAEYRDACLGEEVRAS
jgi:AraC-like DNA-binding protein